jgi:hypothetical protein
MISAQARSAFVARIMLQPSQRAIRATASRMSSAERA